MIKQITRKIALSYLKKLQSQYIAFMDGNAFPYLPEAGAAEEIERANNEIKALATAINIIDTIEFSKDGKARTTKGVITIIGYEE